MSTIVPARVCPRCGESFPSTLKYFHKRSSRKDGLHPVCKTCRKPDTRRSYERNKANILKANALWRIEHPAEMKQYQQKYVEAHPERVEKSKKQYYETHKSQIGEKTKRYRSTHPDEYKARMAVQVATKKGVIPKVTTLKCETCPRNARHYHHWSYEPDHWLDVVPLCTKCHRKIHVWTKGDTHV